MKKYEELIKLESKEKTNIDIPFEIKRAESEATLEVAKCKNDLMKKEQLLSRAYVQIPISFKHVKSCRNAVQLAKRDLNETLEIQKELF